MSLRLDKFRIKVDFIKDFIMELVDLFVKYIWYLMIKDNFFDILNFLMVGEMLEFFIM